MQQIRSLRWLALTVRLVSLAIGITPILGTSTTVQYAYDASGNTGSRAMSSVGLPQIIRQPVNQVVEMGARASFSVVIANALGVTFQWKFNGANIAGATGDSIVLTNITAANEGQYAVVVTNASGIEPSADAALMIDSDGDGMPDSWELTYFANLSQTATGDFDGDGVSNFDEYFQGTAPSNNASFRVRLSVTTIGGGTVDISPFRESYVVGETVTLTAVPSSVNGFNHWSGDLTGAANSSTLVLTANKSVTATFVSLPVPPGLIAWWRGETDASDIIAGHHGAFYAGAAVVGPSVTPAGLVEGAFDFDGTVHVRVPDAADLRPARLTVETWVFPTVQTASPQTLVARGSFTNDNNVWSLSLLNGRARFASLHVTGGQTFIEAPSIIPLNQWTHLAITFDGVRKSIYINGVQAASAIGLGPLSYDPAVVPVTLGSDWAANASTDRFTGRLDEVSFYDRALSLGEINAISSAGRTGKCVTQPYLTTSERLREGIVGDSYTGSIAAIIGTLPMSFSLLSGTLPPGLSLNASGMLGGVPTIAGDYEFVLAVRDTSGRLNQQTCSLRVDQRIAPPLGMLAWWRAESDPSGLAKDVIAGHDGTFYRGTGTTPSSPVHTTEGEVASAFMFDGSLHIRVPDSASLHPAKITAEAWIYSTWLNGNFQTIVARGSTTGNEDAWYLGLQNGYPQFYSEHQIGGTHALQASSPLPLYTWTHLAGTFEDGKKVLYVNGVPVATQIGLSALKYSAGPAPVTIGADWGSNGSLAFFSGRVDEVTLYGRALSDWEISAIVSSGAAGKSIAGPFELDLGSTATDRPFSYAFTFAGVAPISYSLVSGLLPPGFVLSPGGLLTGTTGTSGNFSFTVRATDANGAIQDQASSLRVSLHALRPAGLISWWRAEHNGDDTIGSNHGIPANAASYRTGKVGAAFELNGTTDFIQIPDTPSLRLSSVTIEAWFMANSLDGIEVIIAKPVGTGSGDSWSIYQSIGQLRAGIGDGNTFVSLGAPGLQQVGRWYHVSYVFDNATHQHSLYLDGIRVATSSVATLIGPIGYDSQPVLIGRDTEAAVPKYFFNGAIDEMSIYNRALDDTEITAIYNGGVAGKALPGTGDDEDWDGDGLANVVEYGLSSDPNRASTGPPATTCTYLDGTIGLVISILRDPAKTDVTLTVESSGDLEDWVPIATSINGSPFSGFAVISGEVPGTAPRVVNIYDPYAEPPEQGRAFLRVRVSR